MGNKQSKAELGSSVKMLPTRKEIKSWIAEKSCAICQQPFAAGEIRCPFDLIKCPEAKEHAFHFRCFTQHTGKIARCPLCNSNCAAALHEFDNALCYALTDKTMAVPAYDNLVTLLKVPDGRFLTIYFNEISFSVRQLQTMIQNLQPIADRDGVIRDFIKMLGLSCKRPEIFDLDKRVLYDEVMSGKYNADSEAFYAILINCNKPFLQPLSSWQIVQFLKSFSILNPAMEHLHRVELLTMTFSRTYFMNIGLESASVHELLSALIDTDMAVLNYVALQNAEFQEFISVEMLFSLIRKLIHSSIAPKDMRQYLSTFKAYFRMTKSCSLELIRMLATEVESEEIRQNILKFLITDNRLSYSSEEIKEILQLFIRNNIYAVELKHIIGNAITNLPLDKYSELMRLAQTSQRFDIYCLLVSYYSFDSIVTKTTVFDLLANPIVGDNNISQLVFAMMHRKFINASIFFELIDHYQRENPAKVLQLLRGCDEELWVQFTIQQIDRLIDICREAGSIELLILFLPALSEAQTAALSNEEVETVIRSFDSVECECGLPSLLYNFEHSRLFFMNFVLSMSKMLTILAPTYWPNLFGRIMSSEYFPMYVKPFKQYSDFLFAIMESPMRKQAVIAMLLQSDRSHYSLAKLTIIQYFLIKKLSPRKEADTKSELDKLLEKYDLDTVTKMTSDNAAHVLESFLAIDDMEVISRLDEF